jgi:hypothetical protein
MISRLIINTSDAPASTLPLRSQRGARLSHAQPDPDPGGHFQPAPDDGRHFRRVYEHRHRAPKLHQRKQRAAATFRYFGGDTVSRTCGFLPEAGGDPFAAFRIGTDPAA